MSSTLSEGVRVPDIGSTSWGADVNYNWTLLNTALANITGNVKTDVANTWTATQTFTETISGSIDGIATRAVGDEDGNNIKTALAGKQSSLSQSQLDACNSGITAAGVQQISTNTSNITALQTAVSNKAEDSDVVHLAGTETVTGEKTWTGLNTFTDWVTAKGYQQFKETISTDVAPTSTQYFGYNYANNSDGKTLLHHRAYVSANTLNNTLRYWVHPNTANEGNHGGFQIVAYGDGTTVATFKPRGNLEPFDTTYGANLGTSSNKWLTLNGINPGALGMPNNSAYIDISSSITNTNWTANYYTPAADGYIMLNVSGCCIIQPSGAVGVSAGFFDGTVSVYDLRVCMPVNANQSYEIYVQGSLGAARFFPCLGNV